VSAGATCTEAQATAWLLAQGKIDALTDFIFNAGVSKFSTATLLRLLNQGDYDGAAAVVCSAASMAPVSVPA
jgi:GH24 family phage-related lysozyme (muramidase)